MHVETVLGKRGRGPVTLRSGESLSRAAGLLAAEACEIVVVCDDDGTIVGVLTDSDILRRVAAGSAGTDPRRDTVDGAMSREVVCCAPEDSLEHVLALMKAHGLRRVPVADADGRLAGVVTLSDLLSWLYEETKLEEDHLKEYFFGIGYR